MKQKVNLGRFVLLKAGVLHPEGARKSGHNRALQRNHKLRYLLALGMIVPS